MGFWDEISKNYTIRPAEINWCEPNYTQSHYIAEFQNSFSSLFITLGGLIGFYWAYKYRHPASLQVLALLIAVVGVGSFLFHQTLLFPMQLLDELPMMYAMTAFIYLFINVMHEMWQKKLQWYHFDQTPSAAHVRRHIVNAEPISTCSNNNDNTNPDNNGRNNNNNNNTPTFTYLKQFYATKYIQPLVVLGAKIPIFNTLFYTNFAWSLVLVMIISSILHAYYGFVIAFELTFIIVSTAAAIGVLEFTTHFISPTPSLENNAIAGYTKWKYFYLCCAASAFGCWLFDNHFCALTLQFPVYISFHALWHTISYLTTYASIVLAGYTLEMVKGASVDTAHLRAVLQKEQEINPNYKLDLITLPLSHGKVVEVALVAPRFITLCTPYHGLLNQKEEMSTV